MFVVDTNVLIYAVDADAEAHAVVRPLVESWRAAAAPWCLTWGICYEFMRVVTHRRVLRRQLSAMEAYDWLAALTAGGGLRMLTPTAEHGHTLRQLLEEVPLLSGNILHDVRTVALMREHGVTRIVTRDTDFHRFQGIEVVDPMVA